MKPTKQEVERALEATGMIHEGAALLGITRHAMKRLIIRYSIEWPKRRTKVEPLPVLSDEEAAARLAEIERAAVARAAEERRERSLDAEIARRWLRERDESRAHGDALARAVDAGLAAGDLEAIRDALRRYVNEEAPALLGLRSLADTPRSG